MSEESGLDSGARGIGTLARWSIPAILGVAASIWLGAFIEAHDFFGVLSQEQRRAVYVGAQGRPRDKIEIEAPNRGCLRIDRVDLDGSTASVYFHSTCAADSHSIEIHYQLISPDGTLLSGESFYASLAHGPDMLRPGEKGEVVLDGYRSIKQDDRTKKVRFWMSDRGF